MNVESNTLGGDGRQQVSEHLAGVSMTMLRQVPVQSFAEENILGAILGGTPHTTATFGIVRPGTMQTPHVQRRPDNGDELILVFEGKFRIVSGNDRTAAHDTAAQGAVYLSIEAGSVASIENVGDSDVVFFSVFSPPFVLGEIEYLR